MWKGRKFQALIAVTLVTVLLVVVHNTYMPVFPHAVTRVISVKTEEKTYEGPRQRPPYRPFNSSKGTKGPASVGPQKLMTSPIASPITTTGGVKPVPLPPGIKFLNVPPITITSNLDPRKAEELFYSYVARNHVTCANHMRVGSYGDGGWDMCLEGPYRPKKPCIVYSFGINNDWSFDDAVSRKFSCEVRAFDPSMRVGDHKHSALVWFYHTGLDGGNSNRDYRGWKLRTLGTLIKELGHKNKIIDYLKIDIEYGEWNSFDGIFKEHSLKQIKQIGFEIHTHELAGGSATTVPLFVLYYNTLKKLEDAGFRRWHHHMNPMGMYNSRRTGRHLSCCYELYYINTRFLQRNQVPALPTAPPTTTRKTTTTTTTKAPPSSGGYRFPAGMSLIKHPHTRVSSDMNPVTAENNFYSTLTTNHITCPQSSRMGNYGDGGWNVCLVGPYKPAKPCIVYSFGINNDWSFDDAISRTYGCEVRAYDPSMGIGDHKHSTLVWFYRTGLGGSNTVNGQGWKIRTLNTLFAELGHKNKIIDYLKIDIEYAEWDSFVGMFREGALKNVKQFGFEVHTHEVGGGAPTTVSQFVSYWQLLDNLERAGFKKWKNHFNPYGRYTSSRTGQGRTCCYEMYYVNINFLKNKR